jgi:hypothetical protein
MRFSVFAFAALLAAFAVLSTASLAGAAADKVWVCKYVGTPNVDERLKEGKNPIEVSVNAIGVSNPQPGDLFVDKHGFSVVVEEGSDCASAPPPEECPPGTIGTPPNCETPNGPDLVLICSNGEFIIVEDGPGVILDDGTCDDEPGNGGNGGNGGTPPSGGPGPQIFGGSNPQGPFAQFAGVAAPPAPVTEVAGVQQVLPAALPAAGFGPQDGGTGIAWAAALAVLLLGLGAGATLAARRA